MLKTTHEAQPEADSPLESYLSSEEIFVSDHSFFANFRRFQPMRGLIHAVALTLLLTLALPAHAADERAVKSRVPPIYPEIAKRMKIVGEVKLDVTIGADGKVKDAKAVSGNHMLGTAAEDAVRKWVYEPGASDSTVVVVVNFTL
jgi:TonB family protein